MITIATTATFARVRARTGPLLLILLFLLGMLAIQVAAPASACACGAIADPEVDDGRTHPQVLEETAVLSMDGDSETVVMGLDLDAETRGATLLMPTPSVPEVSAGDSATLREIQLATAPREDVEYTLFGEIEIPLPGSSAPDGGAAGAPEGSVEVHSQQRIGDFEVAVIDGDVDGVTDWLDTNGYVLDDTVIDLLPDYLEDGWTFTAVRYAEDAQLSGDVEPLRFDFETDEFVYPMRLSQAAQETQNVHLFVIADEPMMRTDASAGSQHVERPWIADPTREDWTWIDSTLREMTGYDQEEYDERRGIVTEFEITGDPSSFHQDLTFGADPDDPYEVPRYTTEVVIEVAGVPVGWLLVALGGITGVSLLLVLARTVEIHRARRRIAELSAPAPRR
jgi:hypothetical protein